MPGMQNKTIRKALNNKIDDWLSTIDDQEVVKAIKKDLIVTGGSIASMVMGDPVNDYDIYFKTKATTIKVAEYYVKKFIALNGSNGLDPEVREETLENIKGETEDRVVIWVASSGYAAEQGQTVDDGSEEGETEEPEEDDGKERYRPVWLSENAITLSNKIQLITRFYGEPHEIHRNYDFVHAKCYYDYKTGHLHTPERALRSMQSMTLKYEGSLYPVCSLFRMRKFIKRGWKISAGEVLKISMQISEIDLLDIHTLREQLTGVDALYFHALIAAIKDKDDNERISTAYVTEIIDRIFNDE